MHDPVIPWDFDDPLIQDTVAFISNHWAGSNYPPLLSEEPDSGAFHHESLETALADHAAKIRGTD